MVDVNNAVTIDSSAFKDILDTMSQHKLGTLTKKLHHGESGQSRSLGIGRGAGLGVSRGGNDGVQINRAIAQGWIDSGELQLDEDAARREVKGQKKLDDALDDLGLKRPLAKA